MAITIHGTFLAYVEPDAHLAFTREAFAIKVRDEVGNAGMRRITVGSADRPGLRSVRACAAAPDFAPQLPRHIVFTGSE